ncbi:HEAT repeat domain-containing protein [Myxococcus llanfairpwllgwyngyllgogerychwyrndrobwllllantysiliogogogochensis]|uniref:HEAT repeat domain-containing protein n=1 Tax=Myxococcus llanfairpwllgwyngyllgogerychwyrndrobwllllantysiliogogogochensis TaxID=2590453 RepID=A0A540WZP6_9BACT|nr:HEAT repeat domain-containing protein [Myxococcus llanfairpwllgwyngyllgogerychwyrndrobwllllantysiliogogogochensis]TQF14488.1 HEAT repeat domain-containing protein [Myxococcus llanfairpwllgwyngyllgogerychwyrndrobwllllantysiliogogogochensis]
MRKSVGLSLWLMLGLGCAHSSGKPQDVVSTVGAMTSQELSLRAEKAYDAEDFATCADLRRQSAEALTDPDLRAEEYYSAAGCASLGGRTEDAMAFLKRAADSGFLSVDQLQFDPELASLHSLPGWAQVVAGVQANLDKAGTPPMPIPVLATIDVSRSRRATAAEVIKMLGLEVGKPIVRSRHLMKKREEALRQRFNLVYTHVGVIAFFAEELKGQAFASVDLVDAEDSHRLSFLPAPTGHVEDPEGLIAHWLEYEDKVVRLMRAGALNTDQPPSCRVAHCSFGFGHPELAPYEPRFVEKAPAAREALLRMLREDADANRRSAVPYVLGYAGTPEQVIGWLLPFFKDPDSGVRNNVVRSVLAFQQGLDRPVVDLSKVFEAMTMPDVSDRNKGTYLLEMVLQKLSPEELKARRAEVLQKVGTLLVDMSAYQQPINREPAVLVLQLLSGEKFERPEQWRQWLSSQGD